MSGTGRLRLLMTVDAVGGVWTYALDLAAGLAGHGVGTVLAVMGPAPAPDQAAAALRVPRLRLVETGLPLEWLAESPAEVVAAGHTLARLAEETGADILHLNAPGPAAGAAFSMPVLIACHSCLATWWRAVRTGPMPADFTWRTELVARAYRKADCLVAPSAGFAAATRAAYGLAAPPMVVRNGRRAAGSAGTPLARPVAFTAGRLWDDGKDAATLDRAAALLPFPVVAAGPVEGPNGARAALAHLRLLGRLPEAEVAGYLAARPIFASAARYEPFGLTVLEAAQAGCALVLADTPVFRELWEGVAQFAPVGDAQAFAEAMRGLAEDGERRAALGVAAQERARRYGIGAQVDAMLAAYRGLLRGMAGGTGRGVAA